MTRSGDGRRAPEIRRAGAEGVATGRVLGGWKNARGRGEGGRGDGRARAAAARLPSRGRVFRRGDASAGATDLDMLSALLELRLPSDIQRRAARCPTPRGAASWRERLDETGPSVALARVAREARAR